MSKFTTLQKIVVVAMIVFAGLALFWMTSSGPSASVGVTKSLKNAKALCVACRKYAFDHDGNFPPSLEALFPDYLQDHSVLVSPLMPSEPSGYIYTPGMKYTGPVNAVVIEDKFAPLRHIRIVSYVDDSARVLNVP